MDRRFKPSVCGQLAALVAERARDSEMFRTVNARTEAIVWDGGAKGIDDAAQAGISLKAITVTKWLKTIEGDSLERVKDVWGRLKYKL